MLFSPLLILRIGIYAVGYTLGRVVLLDYTDQERKVAIQAIFTVLKKEGT